MKKYILSVALGVASLFSTSCSDEDYSQFYNDPSMTTKVSCEKIMTGVFRAGNDYTQPSYWRMWTFDNGYIGKFAGVVGFMNGDGRYCTSDGYPEDRWQNFYTVLNQYRLLEKTYKNLPDEEKSSNEVFVILAKIFLYDHLEQIISMWGDVPFSKAGFLGLTGDVANSYPAYEDDHTLYQLILDDLKTLESKLASMTNLSTVTTGYLAAQDYFCKGDLTMWRKYANSLRLRVAMRVASQGALASNGQAVVKELLSGSYLLLENGEAIEVLGDQDGFKIDNGQQNAGYMTTYRNLASKQMLDVLGTDDPRLDVMYDHNKNGEYIGLYPEEPYQDQLNYLEGVSTANYYYAVCDSATFGYNMKHPGLLMASSEVAFLKAEAYQKGYVNGDAKAAFVNGVKNHVDYMFYMNGLSEYRPALAVPTAADIMAFATSRWEDATDKYKAIIEQKWLALGFIQACNAWAEVRRTGIPAITFPADPTSVICPNVPNRLRYPIEERNSNPNNYAAVQSQDNYTDKLFWAK